MNKTATLTAIHTAKPELPKSIARLPLDAVIKRHEVLLDARLKAMVIGGFYTPPTEAERELERWLEHHFPEIGL